MQDFRKLAVWEKSHQLTLAVYSATHSFPKEEVYGLTNQMRRAATSVPTNIAEGSAKGSDIDFARYLQISLGSATELEYQFLLAHDLGYLQPVLYGDLQGQVVEVKKMLIAFIQKLRLKR